MRGLEERGSDKLWRRYRDYLDGEVAVLAFDANAARAYARVCALMKLAGARRNMADILIAAAATAQELTLATLNVRHFEGIDNLRVEDWSS